MNKKSTSATYSDSIDIQHIHLAIDMTDFTNKELKANAQYDVVKKIVSQNKIVFDFIGFTIDSIKINSIATTHTRKDSTIQIDIPSTLLTSSNLKVNVYYHGVPFHDNADWGGFYWDNVYAYNVGVSFKYNPHSFGRAWFPCMDNFVERSTYSYAITTLPQHKAFCNGLLDSFKTLGNSNKVWYWSIKQTIPSYLASMAVSDYVTHVEVHHGIPIQIAVRSGDSLNLTKSFANLKKAIDAFEKLGGAYPFDRVGYCVTPFSAGAMEHATNITYMLAAVDGTISQEYLYAHELSHMWFGDKSTCDHPSDMWLNEGFASYCEAYFTEQVYGKEAYKNYMRVIHDKALRLGHIDDGAFYPLNQVPLDHTYGTTVYKKGADIVHTLRGSLGDSLFYSFIKNYLSTYAYKDVNSKKMEQLLQTHTPKAKDLFDGWVYQAGYPEFSFLYQGSSCPIGKKSFGDESYGCFQTLQRNYNRTNLVIDQPIELTLIDKNWKKTIINYFIGSECNMRYLGEITFKVSPIFIALDMEEKISDASIKEYKIIKNIGVQSYDQMYFKANVSSMIDSVLLRIVYSYLPPYNLYGVDQNMKIGNHTWYVDGIWDSSFHTKMQFYYDGSLNSISGYVDTGLIMGTEDSLVLMYRRENIGYWEIEKNQKIVPGSKFDKRGYIEIPNAQKGYYFLGYKTNVPQIHNDEKYYMCIGWGIENQSSSAFSISPNPSKSLIKIDFEEQMSDEISIVDITGKVVLTKKIDHENSIFIDTENLKSGIYFLNCKLGVEKFVVE